LSGECTVFWSILSQLKLMVKPVISWITDNYKPMDRNWGVISHVWLRKLLGFQNLVVNYQVCGLLWHDLLLCLQGKTIFCHEEKSSIGSHLPDRILSISAVHDFEENGFLDFKLWDSVVCIKKMRSYGNWVFCMLCHNNEMPGHLT
jgi:hypothetical protein